MSMNEDYFLLAHLPYLLEKRRNYMRYLIVSMKVNENFISSNLEFHEYVILNST